MQKKTRKKIALCDLSTQRLTPETFESIYNTIANLRFPVDVAQVLDLRYVINHAVDDFPEPTDTRDYQEFQDALLVVLDTIGLENKRHRERMLRILTMVRDLHYKYSINTRNTENSLREQIAHNRKTRSDSVRYGLLHTFSGVISGIGWLAIADYALWIKFLTVGFIYFSWHYLHALPELDREMKSLEREMSNLMRGRVRSIHWRTIAQKLALVLGYKHDHQIEVFRLDHSIDPPDYSHARH